MDSLPPDFSAPPTFIEHTVFTRDFTGWPTCWSFDRRAPFRQNAKGKLDKSTDQNRIYFFEFAEVRSAGTLSFALDRGKSYAYISPQSRNASYRLAPMAFRPDDLPSYRVYFSGNLVNSKNDTYPASIYLDSDHVLLTYYPSDEKQKYPIINGNILKLLKSDNDKIEKKIIPDGEKILSIHKDMFLGVTAWERIYPKHPVYYDRRIDHDSFFLEKRSFRFRLIKISHCH